MALLMVLAVSILTSTLTFVANTETISSLSYTTMTQVRYGAESGIHSAANHLLFYLHATGCCQRDRSDREL